MSFISNYRCTSDRSLQTTEEKSPLEDERHLCYCRWNRRPDCIRCHHVAWYPTSDRNLVFNQWAFGYWSRDCWNEIAWGGQEGDPRSILSCMTTTQSHTYITWTMQLTLVTLWSPYQWSQYAWYLAQWQTLAQSALSNQTKTIIESGISTPQGIAGTLKGGTYFIPVQARQAADIESEITVTATARILTKIIRDYVSSTTTKISYILLDLITLIDIIREDSWP